MARIFRILARIIFLLVVPLAAVAAGSYFYVTSGRYVSTENAYVKTRKVAVSPDISGRVTAVMVSENQRVPTWMPWSCRPTQPPPRLLYPLATA